MSDQPAPMEVMDDSHPQDLPERNISPLSALLSMNK